MFPGFPRGRGLWGGGGGLSGRTIWGGGGRGRGGQTGQVSGIFSSGGGIWTRINKDVDIQNIVITSKFWVTCL